MEIEHQASVEDRGVDAERTTSNGGEDAYSPAEPNDTKVEEKLSSAQSSRESSRERERSLSRDSERETRERSRSRNNRRAEGTGNFTKRYSNANTRKSGKYNNPQSRNRRYTRVFHKRDGLPCIELENIDSKLCYREYVLQESDTITMEEAERGYENYCRRQQYKNAMVFFDGFANQEWLVETYVPSAHKEYLLAQQAEHAREAAQLAEEIASGSLLVDPATAHAPRSLGLEQASCVRDVFAERYIHSVPAVCTRACLREYVQPLRGFVALYFGDAFHCPPSDLSRPAYVLFDSREAAEAAFKHMAGMHVPVKDTNHLGMRGLKEEEDDRQGSFILLCSLWRAVQKPYVVNAAANRADRIDRDYEACVALLTALRQYWAVDVDIVAAVNEARAKNAWLTKRDVVDVLVHCLRRVYGYEYWKGQYLVEYGRCFHYFGPDGVRSLVVPEASNAPATSASQAVVDGAAPAAPAAPAAHETPEAPETPETPTMPAVSTTAASAEEDNEWERNLDKETASFLESLKAQTLKQSVEEETPADAKEKEIRKNAQEAFIAKKTLSLPGEDETKETRQCGICKKVFRSGEFVKKHLLAKHSGVIKVVETKAVLLELVRSDYLKDPSAKIPVMIPAKNHVARGAEATTAPRKTDDYANKAKLLEYANSYRDRDAVSGIRVQTKKTISDVFDDF